MTTVALFLLLLPASTLAYISESWAMLTSDRPSTPKCVPIPRNLTLCYGMQYTTMRLPNLLEHETVNEVIEQAAPWRSLLGLNCHPDTQGCESRMRQYGFPWPDMLLCSKYPADNDMCIGALSHKSNNHSRSCPSCSQVGTYENILDHYCRSQIVVKARIGRVNVSHVSVRKARSLKRHARRRSIPKDTVIHFSADRHCPCSVGKDLSAKFLIMANRNEKGDLIANLILPWNKSDKPFKRAIRSFQKLNCQSLGREIRESAYRRSAHHHSPHRYHIYHHGY